VPARPTSTPAVSSSCAIASIPFVIAYGAPGSTSRTFAPIVLIVVSESVTVGSRRITVAPRPAGSATKLRP
jgi:hypothetical protein